LNKLATAQSALLFSTRNRDMSVSGDGINFSFDIITQEDHSWQLKISQHPVEEGSPFADHIRQEIRKGSLVGLISNFGLKRGEIKSNYAQDTFDLLENYKENAVPVTIVTSLKTYVDYIITGMKASRNGQSGEAQFYSLTFEEFRIVKLKQTEGVSVINISSTDLTEDSDAQQASPNADVGEQNPEDPLGKGKLERFLNFTDFASGAYK
jgi:hypothetical protein